MHDHSIHIQRELTWLFYSSYKLSPEKLRPTGASETVDPKVSVLKIDDGYVVSFVWDGADAEFTIPDDKVLEVLRQQTSHRIDAELKVAYKGKPYIRRPLLTELVTVAQHEGVLVSFDRKGKVLCEEIRVFPWRSEYEFSCADTRAVEYARRINKMIVNGNAIASPF
jgi:hypothetical protein